MAQARREYEEIKKRLTDEAVAKTRNQEGRLPAEGFRDTEIVRKRRGLEDTVRVSPAEAAGITRGSQE